MGACASRPKDLKKAAPPPSESEAPITPKKPELVDPATATAPLQDETTNKELLEPLVDVSEVPAASEANTKVEEEKAEAAAVKEKEKEKEDKTQHSDVVQA